MRKSQNNPANKTIPNFSYEKSLWAQDVTCIAGVDEAGRGALAGPVAAGAVILNANCQQARYLLGVRDSKQMTPAARLIWAEKIKNIALSWAVGYASVEEIDQLGIASATRLAMSRAVNSLEPTPQHLLIDYVRLPDGNIPQTAIVKGDVCCLSIAAASILAKTARDALMCVFDQQYPEYDFSSHKGYGTQKHLRALTQYGVLPIHRRSFAPVRLLCDERIDSK